MPSGNPSIMGAKKPYWGGGDFSCLTVNVHETALLTEDLLRRNLSR